MLTYFIINNKSKLYTFNITIFNLQIEKIFFNLYKIIRIS